MISKKIFPKNFLWGAAISSHQVEGGTDNNWSTWEKIHAERLAKESNGLNYLSNWKEIEPFSTNPNNYISGNSTNHFELYEKDFDIAKELGLNALRFSIEWSRIEPIEGHYDSDAIKFYHRYINELHERGIEPVVTLWHWTVPNWFEEKGGFTQRSNLKYFERFLRRMVSEYKDKVEYWITLNEPRIFASASYLEGRWPPQKKNLFTYFAVMNNLELAHRTTHRIMREIDESLKLGIAENVAYYTSGVNPLDKIVTKFLQWYEFRIIRRLNDSLDFIGVNFYFHRRIINLKEKNENKHVSDLGWELYPEGIYPVLKRLNGFKKPIIITENGLADRLDRQRSWYIQEIITYIERAVDDGIDVKGYLHWSLIDNFEWAYGAWPRFGLIEVDYENNYARRVRDSAMVYKRLIEERT